MFRTVLAATLILSATSASADLIRVPSAHDVDTTIDRLAAAVEGAGAKVFARVEHARGAESVGMELTPMAALIFGNPKLGTPALQAAPTMGVDLPLRVVAYKDGDSVVMVYHDPADVAALHGLAADHPVIGKMRGALGKLTAKAGGQ